MGYLLESQHWNVTLGTEEAQAPCSCSLHLHRRKQRHSNTSVQVGSEHRLPLQSQCYSPAKAAFVTACSWSQTHSLREQMAFHGKSQSLVDFVN